MIPESSAVELSGTVTHFTEHAQWTGVMASERESWLGMRRTMLTASEMAMVIGESTYGDALKVFLDKTTERIAPEQVTIDGKTSHLFWGSVLEQPILRAAATYYGWDYHEGGALLRSRHFDFLGCTLDAEIDRHDGRGWVDLEGKTSVLTRAWDEESGTLPGHILVQAQQQLMVTGAPCCLVYALLQGSRPCKIEVLPSVEYHAALFEHGQQFMDRVRRLEPPEPTWLSKTSLERIYPDSNGGTVMLPDSAVDWTSELSDLAKEAAKLAKRRDELRNMLRKAIGNCTFGELPQRVNGKKYWRWIETDREGYTVEPSKSFSLMPLNNATMPNQSVRDVTSEPVYVELSDDLADGETVTRLRKRRR
jgi:predicted phage-related endonuclease